MAHTNISVPEKINEVVGLIAKHEDRTKTAVIERSLRCYLVQNPTLVPAAESLGIEIPQEGDRR